jgi:hypothetical protein
MTNEFPAAAAADLPEAPDDRWLFGRDIVNGYVAQAELDGKRLDVCAVADDLGCAGFTADEIQGLLRPVETSANGLPY